MMFSVLLLITLIVELCCVDISASSLQNMPFTSYVTHESQLHKILSDIIKRPEGKKITLQRRPEQSHCPRPHAYKSNSIQLDISQFDKLLNVEYLRENNDLMNLISYELKSRANNDEIFAVADVQALMSMEQLVRVSLARRCNNS